MKKALVLGLAALLVIGSAVAISGLAQKVKATASTESEGPVALEGPGPPDQLPPVENPIWPSGDGSDSTSDGSDSTSDGSEIQPHPGPPDQLPPVENPIWPSGDGSDSTSDGSDSTS